MSTFNAPKIALAVLLATGAALSAVSSADARGRHGGHHGGHHGYHGHHPGHVLPYGNAAIRPSGFVPSSRICSWEVRWVHGEPRHVRVCDSLGY